MELAPTPVRVAAGDDVGLADSEPPGALDPDDLTVVVVTTGFAPATVVVVFVPAAPAVVVVVGAVVVLVVVEAADLADVDLFELFLLALGLELPQAAAIRPAVRMTAPTLMVLSERP
jgi:hypothetical protein